jgi:hypothetical protein
MHYQVRVTNGLTLTLHTVPELDEPATKEPYATVTGDAKITTFDLANRVIAGLNVLAVNDTFEWYRRFFINTSKGIRKIGDAPKGTKGASFMLSTVTYEIDAETHAALEADMTTAEQRFVDAVHAADVTTDVVAFEAKELDAFLSGVPMDTELDHAMDKFATFLAEREKTKLK